MFNRTDLYGEVRTYPEDLWVDLDKFVKLDAKMDMERKFSHQEYTVTVWSTYEVS